MARKYHMKRVELYKKLVDNTWESTAIVLTDANKINVKEGIGKIKDTFKFRINHANDRLTRRFYSGDSSTTAFTLLFAPPSTFLGTDKFQVMVDNELTTYNASPSDATQYSLSGTTLTFGAAPGTAMIILKLDLKLCLLMIK